MRLINKIKYPYIILSVVNSLYFIVSNEVFSEKILNTNKILNFYLSVAIFIAYALIFLFSFLIRKLFKKYFLKQFGLIIISYIIPIIILVVILLLQTSNGIEDDNFFMFNIFLPFISSCLFMMTLNLFYAYILRSR